MNQFFRICIWFYHQIIKLYPADFRAEFQKEMEVVFDDALTACEVNYYRLKVGSL